MFLNLKKGGVHLTKDPKVAGDLVKSMVGNSLRTKQTGPEGVPVSKVMVAHVSYFIKFVDNKINCELL